MEVRVELEILPPTVQDCEKTDLRPEMLRIPRNGSQGLGRNPEEDAQDQLFILVCNSGDLLRHGKDDVKIADLQEFGLAVFDPFRPGQRLAFGAMPIAATIEAIPFSATLIATFQVAAQRGCAAHLNGGHDAPLCCGHRRAMIVSIGFSVAAKHVRYFPLRPIHDRTVRSAEESRVRAQPQPDAGGGRAGWMRNRPCWWRSADNERSSPGYGGRAAVEWYGHPFRIQVDGRQRRA
jgi:hypothetical protein